MFKNVLSKPTQKLNFLSFSSVLLILVGISNRSFGLPKEMFYALFLGIFIFIITTIQVRNFILPKNLFFTIILTYLLTFAGLVHFYFERESNYTQQLLFIFAIFKTFDFCTLYS